MKINWNIAGRVLVFLNLAMSLGFAYIGFGLYSGHIDWGEKQKQGADELTRLQNQVNLAMGRWQSARTAVIQREQRRPIMQEWYAKELDKLRTGNQPPQALVRVRGVLQPDPKGFPLLGPVMDAKRQPVPNLASIDELNHRYSQTDTDIANLTAEIKKLQDRQKELTAQIGNGLRQGLRFQLARDQQEEKNSQLEQEYLKPRLYNALAEAHILQKRQRALEARLHELETAKVASRP
jgi:hypothetical protein